MIERVVFTTEEVMARYGWSGTATIWRKQNEKVNPFPLPDIQGSPNRWLKESLHEWEASLKEARRLKQGL